MLQFNLYCPNQLSLHSTQHYEMCLFLSQCEGILTCLPPYQDTPVCGTLKLYLTIYMHSKHSLDFKGYPRSLLHVFIIVTLVNVYVVKFSNIILSDTDSIIHIDSL